MKLIDALISMVAKDGMDKVASNLGIRTTMLKQYCMHKKKPSIDVCQRIIDWNQDNFSLPEPPPIGEEIVSINYAEGVSNCSYCPPEWGKKKKVWDGRDVCLCLPTYGPIPEAAFFSFMCLAMRYRMGMRLEHRGNDSMIARSRNQLSKRFLKTDATWSIWLDSDMVFPFGVAGPFLNMTGMKHLANKFADYHVIERLISHDKSMVGGCYWDRMGQGRLIAGSRNPLLAPIPSDNLGAVDFVGTGCLAVKRQVFLDIAEKFPETLTEDAYGNETGFFTPIQGEKRMLGEDESFAWRATQAGHPTYIDLGLICGHVGQTIHGMPENGSRI